MVPERGPCHLKHGVAGQACAGVAFFRLFFERGEQYLLKWACERPQTGSNAELKMTTDQQLYREMPIGLLGFDPHRLGLTLAAVVAFGSALVLIFGWGYEVDWFRRIASGFPAMVPATALTLVAGGLGTVALFLRASDWIARGAAVAILGIVVLENVSSLTPADLRTSDGMSAASMICALFLGLSLLLRSFPLKIAPIVVDTIGLIVATVPLIGYVFGASTLYENPLYTLMALHTALSHALLFAALLLTEPHRGWIEVLLAGEPGSRMARRVLPVTILMPLLLSLLVAEAVERDIMTVEFRLAVLTFMIICSTVTAVIGFAHLTNRTDRKNSEAEAAYLRSEMLRQQAELSAARAEKVAALGQLVGGVAHDFNNTLHVILGNLELLEEDPDKGNRHRYVSEAISASIRAADLTRQLLAYGRKSQLNPAVVSLESEINGAIVMFSRICPANISITLEFHLSGVLVQLDSSGLQQAVLNVLINARDALPDGGDIRIKGQVETLEGAAVAGFHSSETLPTGTYATLRIEDNGIGMTSETVTKATEPFFTTKGIGEGTGLGLSTVAGYCRQSEGGLRIDSTLGNGTSITLAFPTYAGADMPSASAPEKTDGAAKERHGVLIVDDDVALTRVMATQLKLAGHEVRVALDAEQALTALDNGPLPEIVLTDIVMPGEMQGHHLAARIRQRYPGVQVILMSGYASASQREQIAATVDQPFLQKPIDARTLRTMVNRAKGTTDEEPQ